MLSLLAITSKAQHSQEQKKFTRSDTLRGSITKYRQGWDVKRYDLQVEVDIIHRSITGSNTITFLEQQPVTIMQVDLQEPMLIDSIVSDSGKRLPFSREGNAWMIHLNETSTAAHSPKERSIKVYYHGVPKQAKNAPWDGGLVWASDKAGNPFVGTACQGLGASVWWPCKDHQSDEPDRGMSISITAPADLQAISNGRLISTTPSANGTRTSNWQVVNPINTYAVTMNIGKYANWKETYDGEAGSLDLEYWVLAENLDKAKKQFVQTKPMLKCFEHWFGKYPFYEDGFKLVETPFLGMEHQSAIAYGNKYQNGYLGRDLSGSGWGLLWDYILVHESGHEWFGNNITTQDIADMWVHEGFTTYSETLYTECHSGKKAGFEYAAGIAGGIDNDRPVIGIYNVNKGGSGDMYPKGATIIHTIRMMMNDDEKFRQLLRDMQQTFFHKITTSKEVEQFIIDKTGLPLQAFFNQYLRTAQIPVVEFYKKGNSLSYRLTGHVKDFETPLIYSFENKRKVMTATSAWKTVTLPKDELAYWKPGAIENNLLLRFKQVPEQK